MDCNQMQRKISAFLKDELKSRELIDFLEHIESCEECKEELTIQYLSSEGILRLEEGISFDLDRELKEHMVRAEKGLQKKRNLIVGFISFELISILIILMTFLYAWS